MYIYLALNAIVPDGTTNFNAEYLFDYSKTTVVYREPLQTTQLTATLICQPILPRTFRCFLQNIMFLTTLKYQNLNVTEEVSREHIKSEQWFETNFNERGIQDILVHIKSDKMLRSIFKDIANQFNVGGELMARMLNMPISHLPSPGFRFTEKEKTPIGTCRTHYYMNVVYGHNERSEKQDSKFQIVPLVMTEHFVQQRNARIRIAKNRHNCEYSVEFNSFLNGMEIVRIYILFYSLHFHHSYFVLTNKKLIIACRFL